MRQLTIASEQLLAQDHWHEIREGEIVGVDSAMTFRRWTVVELLAAA